MAQLSRQSARNQTWVLPFFAFFCDVRMIRAAHAPTEIAALAAGAMHPDGIPSVPELFNSPTPKNPPHCDEQPLLRISNEFKLETMLARSTRKASLKQSKPAPSAQFESS